jgi:hypothetical protein
LRVRADRSLFFLIPGDLGARTGGYRYDLRVIAGLRERGWAVEVVGLDAASRTRQRSPEPKRPRGWPSSTPARPW